MTQALSTWLVGHFSLVMRGRYELVYLVVPLVVLAWLFSRHFNIVGIGQDFSREFWCELHAGSVSRSVDPAMITASIVTVVGSISYIGLIVPESK